MDCWLQSDIASGTRSKSYLRGRQANTWIQANPPALTQDDTYLASVTLQGTGDVYLDFYNGREDLVSETVQLTSAPQTLTLQGEVPSDYSTPLQVRTVAAGPVDLYASGAAGRPATTLVAFFESSLSAADLRGVIGRGGIAGSPDRRFSASSAILTSC